MILDIAVLRMKPVGSKAGTLYSQIPRNSSTGDFAVLRNSSSNRTNQQKQIERIEANEPRIDWSDGDATLLTEAQVTELTARQLSFGHSDWTKSGATIEGDPSSAGADVNASYDFTTGWTLSNSSAVNSTTLRMTSETGWARKSLGLSIGTMYMLHIAGTQQSGQIFGIRNYDGSTTGITNINETTFDKIFYYIATTDGIMVQNNILPDPIDDISITTFTVQEVTGFQSPSIDNPTEAYKLVESTTTGLHGLYSGSSGGNIGELFTTSFYVKAGERNWVIITDYNAGNVSFNLENGVIGTETNAVGSIKELGNGWYRISSTYLSTSATEEKTYLYLADADNSPSYTGDGTSGVYIFGANLTESDHVMPFVFDGTEGTQTVVLADVISLGDLVTNNILSSTVGVIDNTLDDTRYTYKYIGDNEIEFYVDGVYAGILVDPPPATYSIEQGKTKDIKMFNTNVSNTLLQLSTEATIDYSTAQGLSWDSSNDAYARLGSISAIATSTSALDANLPIQAAMKRCLLNDDGTVNYYLDASNSALKATGGASDLTGTDGQVMVEIPKFWFKESLVGTVKSWYISLNYISGFELHPAFWKDGVKVDYRYMSAFEGGMWDASTGAMCAEASIPSSIYASGDKMTSVAGTWAKTNQQRHEYRTMAAERGTGWRQLDYYLHSAVQLLYLVEYADFNSQTMIGAGRTNLSGGSWTAGSYIGLTGLSVGDGNGTNSVMSGDLYAVNGNGYATDYMTYRGIENLYGNVWKMADGITWDGRWTGTEAAQPIYVTNNSDYFADETSVNMKHICDATYIGASSGYAANIENVVGFIPSTVGAISTTKLTDYYYQYSEVGRDYWRVFLVGGFAYHGGQAGAFTGYAFYTWSRAAAYVGGRLCF